MEQPSRVRIAALVAMNRGRVIGRNGALPWHIPEDLKRFSALTRGHTVLMGRRTYESLPARVRPLPERLNVVVSRLTPPAVNPDLRIISDPRAYIAAARSGAEKLHGSTLWIIGGGELYRATQETWDEIFLTMVQSDESGDTTFPPFQSEFTLESSESGQESTVPAVIFQHWIRRSGASTL